MELSVDLNREIIFASADSEVSRQMSDLLRQGRLKKIAPRIYTTNLVDSPENIVRRNLLNILMWRFPGCVISHRSAKEMRPTASGNFYLSGNTSRKVTDLPGLVIYILKGPKADEMDMPLGSLFIAGEYRWMLENMQPSRKPGDESKVLPISVIERKLENVMLAGGEAQLNIYRDTLRKTAERLGMPDEFEKINRLISALLSTKSSDVLSTPSAKAMAVGLPFDENRVKLFETLFNALQESHFLSRPVGEQSEEDSRNVAFFESYFSNYIEGTEFEIDEARDIVDSGMLLPNRREDSHDILGTFNVLSNRSEMQIIPADSRELTDILRRRHAVLLSGRPDLEPGQFKEKNNRAGNTEFVDAKLVHGTLDAGFGFYAALASPVAKAIYMMFFISEIHPFNDGNGRVARVMMNAELFRAGEAKIIVPTVYREDYLLSLRKLSRQNDPDAFIRVMARLHDFSSKLYGLDFEGMEAYLRRCNAFEDPQMAKLKFE